MSGGYLTILYTLIATALVAVPATGQDTQPGARPVTVADIIRTTTIGDPGSSEGGDVVSQVAEFAPDGRHVAIVVRHGNLEENAVESSILVFTVATLFEYPRPDTVVTFASSSNHAPIAQVRWLRDNRRLAFLGERASGERQVYLVDIETRALARLTDQQTAVLAYDITPNAKVLAYLAEAQPDTSGRRWRHEHGYVMTATTASDAVLDRKDFDRASQRTRLFVKTLGVGEVVPVPDSGLGQCIDELGLFLDPTGRFVIRVCTVLHAPAGWAAYADRTVRDAVLADRGSAIWQYKLVDVRRGTIIPLFNAPIPWREPTLAWAPDGSSVAVGNVFLPLDSVDGAERTRRIATLALAEVQLAEHAVTPLLQGDSVLALGWATATNTLVAVRAGKDSAIAFRKAHRRWQRVPSPGPPGTNTRASYGPITLKLDQDPNAPPTLVATDAQRHRRVVLLDPNPQFKALRLGRVENITWRTRDGRPWRGGLYYPPDYVKGERYPIVIQTHGFDSTSFSLYGPFTTAFAAQALAAHGILVLQTSEPYEDQSLLFTVRELPLAMAHYEAAIDYLDQRGLVDRTRVGIVGFSRTCLYVKYTLTHSTYAFAAAAVTDGVDDSYLQYLLNPEVQWFFELDIGAAPFGAGLDAWRRESPGFNMDRIHTPMRIEAMGPWSVLAEWEMYAGLKRLHQPVEMFVIPDGVHVLTKPWERLASSEGNVDWLRFWLKGEEDPDPAKADQYSRWRELRNLQAQQQRASSDTSSSSF